MIIAWLLILVGGIAIYAGFKGSNPLQVIKDTIGGK